MKLAPLVIVLLFITGCSDSSREQAPLHSQIGKNCIVYFRKDALGMAADIPSSVTTGSWNGATVTQIGELLEVGDDWIVIGHHGRVFHIPRGAIQMMEFGSNVHQGSRLSLPLTQPGHDHGHGDHSHTSPAEQAH